MKLGNCPVCKGELEIRRYHCRHCDISFDGSFSRNWLEGINESQMEFIKLFLLVQGNFTEVQKKLGISYPTIKNRLAQINQIIIKEYSPMDDYSDILGDLEEGFIDVDEALAMINKRREK
ncbi:MAG: DUF2089 family protein [Candidatus Cloacimonetes bacterium]|jgi:hypothetical protein|nr:DUF2089 family protein [Candidatus Cloacimonadota bacterium]HQB97760.1 DUF2089 family protein [Candidatus Cloacimonadota bacterium]